MQTHLETVVCASSISLFITINLPRKPVVMAMVMVVMAMVMAMVMVMVMVVMVMAMVMTKVRRNLPRKPAIMKRNC